MRESFAMHFCRQKDVKLFLILIPACTAVNYFIIYSDVVVDANFFKALVADTIQGYVFWLALRYIIFYIRDKKIFADSTWKRLLLQFPLTFVVSVGICMIPYGQWPITGHRISRVEGFNTHELFIFLFWVTIINFIYIGMGYYDSWKAYEAKLHAEQTPKTKGFTVRIGEKNIKVQLENILGFYVEDGCTYMIDSQCKSYIVDTSLYALEEKLPPRYFFRINHKFILHRNSIVSFRRIEDNKLLILTPDIKPLPVEVTMSRLKAPAFKKWFEADAVL